MNVVVPEPIYERIGSYGCNEHVISLPDKGIAIFSETNTNNTMSC